MSLPSVSPPMGEGICPVDWFCAKAGKTVEYFSRTLTIGSIAEDVQMVDDTRNRQEALTEETAGDRGKIFCGKNLIMSD